MKRRETLGFRLAILTASMVFILIAVYASVGLFRYYRFAAREVDRAQQALRSNLESTGAAVTKATGQLCAGALASNDFEFLEFAIDSLESSGTDLTFASIVNRDGHVIAGTPAAELPPDDVGALGSASRTIEGVEIFEREDGIEFRRRIRASNMDFGEIRVGMSLDTIQRHIREQTALVRKEILIGSLVNVATALLFMGVGVVGAVVISRRISHPLVELEQAAREVGSGQLESEVPVRTGDEVGRLAEAFNEMTGKLRHSQDTVARLNDTLQELSATVDPDELFVICLERMRNITGVQGVAYYLQMEDGRWALSRMSAGWRYELMTPVAQLLDEMTMGGPIQTQQPFVTRVATNGSAVPVLCAPVGTLAESAGLFVLQANSEGPEFTANHIEPVQAIARHLSVCTENLARVRMESELETARIVQETLLPPLEWDFKWAEVAAWTETASETGGDWFWYERFHSPEGLGFYVGDVTGHGVPAALLVSAVRSALVTTLEQAYDPYPGHLLSVLNRVVMECARGRLKMTLLAAVFDAHRMRLVYANAGHVFPLHWSASKKRVRKLKASGARLGHLRDSQFKEKEVVIDHGDVVLFYTDGLVECENARGEPFGTRALSTFLKHYHGYRPAEMCERLANQIQTHRGEADLDDDIAVLAVRFL